MAGTPPPFPPPYSPSDWKHQRRLVREQAKAQRDLNRDQWKRYREQRRVQVRGTRGGSILGPLLLILLGVVFFLLRLGRLDYGTVGAWYERWWPLLLLLGGVVLLAEWAFERSRSADQPYGYRTRIGGGVVALLVLLCIPGILLSASHNDLRNFTHGFGVNPENLDQFLGDRHESDQALDQALAPGGTLTIDNPHGDVTVTGTSSDDHIHIAVHKEVFSRADSDATEKATQLAPKLTKSGAAVFLTLPTVDSARADLTVTVPSGTPITITADHGSIHASLLKAALILTSNHGDVEVDAIGGPITTHINNRGSSFNARGVAGSVSLEGDCRDVDMENVSGAVSLRGDFFGTTHLQHVSGMVRFHTSRTDFQLARLDGEVEIKRGELSGDQILGPVTLSARSYNVNLDRVTGDVSVATSDGSVDLISAPPMGNVTIQNRNGSVNVTVPEHAPFTVQAETRDGDIETEFPLATSDENSVKRLSGSVGAGGSLLRINTTQNDISLKKGIIAPLAPPPPPTPAITLAPQGAASPLAGKLARTPRPPHSPAPPPPPSTSF